MSFRFPNIPRVRASAEAARFAFLLRVIVNAANHAKRFSFQTRGARGD
jgi:hypothetical protein